MSDEIAALVTQLREACTMLDRLAQPTYPAAISSKHTCAEIYSHISRAIYQGRRVSPHWSKPELVAAYISIKTNMFEAEREHVLRQLADYGIGRQRALAAVRQPPHGRSTRQRANI